MTKKDYIKIAKVLKEIKPKKIDTENVHSYGLRLALWDKIVVNLADIFKEDNDRFNEIKFFRAVGYLD